jgi:hypothetical protein
LRIEAAPEDRRAALLDEIDGAGLIATPRNSSYNEAVIEAGRRSIVDGGSEVRIAI